MDVKRACYYQMHDDKGVVDDYVIYILKCLRSIAERIVLISNGSLEVKSRLNVMEYVDCIYERNDSGFDCGAFCEYFLCENKENLDLWDEIILLNDSIYGPVFSLKDWFIEDNECNLCDFWGITGYKYLLTDNRGNKTEHYGIDPYFVVIKKKILQSGDFITYWEKVSQKKLITYSDVVRAYERGFTSYFVSLGYRAYTRIPLDESVGDSAKKICWECLERVKKRLSPIIKRKVFSVYNYVHYNELLEYLDEESNYDTGYIISNLRRLSKTRNFVVYALEDFIRNYDKVYIYGEGLIGNGVKEYLDLNSHVFSGFVTTEGSESSKRFEDIIIGDNEGLIVGLGNRYLDQNNMKRKIEAKVGSHNVYYVMN